MDYYAFSSLVYERRFAMASRCLSQMCAFVEPATVVQSLEQTRTLINFALFGGYEAAQALEKNVKWGSFAPGSISEVPYCLSEILFITAYAQIGVDEGQKSLAERAKHFATIACLLPHASNRRRSLIDKWNGRLLASAQFWEIEVTEKNGKKNLRDALRRPALLEIVKCIGTTDPFDAIRETLLVYAVSDNYATIAEDYLKRVCECCEWPMFSCLGPSVPILMHDKLLEWFLKPSKRINFTSTAVHWLREELCYEPDTDPEPQGNFQDDDDE